MKCDDAHVKPDLHDLIKDRWFQCSIGFLVAMVTMSVLIPRHSYITSRVINSWVVASWPFTMAATLRKFSPHPNSSNSHCDGLVRVAIAVGLSGTASSIGSMYPHLCASGVKWLELGAMFGVPAFTFVWIIATKLRPRSIAPPLLLILATAVIREPYLSWSHGDPTEWTPVFDRVLLPQRFNEYKYKLKNGMLRVDVEELLGPGEPSEPEDPTRRQAWRDGYEPTDQFAQWVIVEGEGFDGLTVQLQFRNGRLVNLNGYPSPHERRSEKTPAPTVSVQ